MLKKVLIIPVILLALLGIALLLYHSNQRAIDKALNRIIPYQSGTGGEACLADLEERGIDFKSLGTSAENDICTIYDVVKIRNFPNTKMSGAVTLNCQTAINLADWLKEIGAKG